ncbi:gustatory and pheromone receptor 33a [Lucilia sericata]|uniref:gustatory and pheromone receptor 33a n=1 Tax=Lucilia sericata TaxID=13632 RepID=UPI0018A7F8DE|nr:gustatory and pheromone receptor 33a [Lucilia sericata]
MNKFQLYLSLIYGVIPYERLNVKANIFFSYVHMYVVPALYLICFGIITLGDYAVYKHEGCDSICRLANILFVHLGLCLYVLTHILTLWRRKQFFIEFEKSLYAIDIHLRKCDELGVKQVEKKKNFKYKYYITWFVVVACFTFAMAYDIKELIFYYRELFFIVFIVSNFPYTSSSIVLGQFVYYVSEISQRFIKLNELFERINRESERKHAPLMIFDIESEIKKEMPSNQELRQRHVVDHISINEDSDEFNDDVDDDLNDAETIPADSPTSETNLPELFKIHDKILSLCVITNAQYGPQCVPYMAVCFVIAIFGIFLQTKVYFVVGGKNPILDYMVFIYMLWSMSLMLVAYLVLRLCCNANGFSKQSAMIVHEIMQKKPAFMLGNDVYYNKMKSFTLQFLHWEGFFQFNGIGLYTLDYTFIFSTVSAATSYLIVLLQFDMSSILRTEGLM